MSDFDLPERCSGDQYAAIVKVIKSNAFITDPIKGAMLELLEKKYAQLMVKQAILGTSFVSFDTNEWDMVKIDDNSVSLKRKKPKLMSIAEDDDEIVLRNKRKHGDTFFTLFN